MTTTATPRAESVDAATASLLALIDGDPLHSEDRARVVTAILTDARAHDGQLDPNRLRALLTDEHGAYTVTPCVVGATVRSLAVKGVLVKSGWVVSTDTRGRNSGKPSRTYSVHP